jgi:hypothetical protein
MNPFKTDFLCASSSFLMGLGSVLAIDGQVYDYNTSDDPDGIAIEQDWKMVGQDMRAALNKGASEATKNKAGSTRK